jgi:nitrite reductase/ring-hydroxylating ferredoxin subunit/uncharacterized membrane protein
MSTVTETIANLIADQDWLDSLADPVQNAVKDLLTQAEDVKDVLHGVWLGHPLHPVLTDIPVGAWTVALVLDALSGMSGREDLQAGADGAVAIGLLGALGSAVTGLADWSETGARSKKIGLVHAALNIVATGLYATSWAMRASKKQRSTAVSLSMLGYAIAGASAYLGGHLVFAEQIGVDHTATADANEPQKYTVVMKESELRENQPTRANANGLAVLLYKSNGSIRAITATCPHLGGPLDEGKVVDGAIECPWHQSQLSLEDGSVVKGPTTYPARCFDVRVRAGNIEVRSATREAPVNEG